jgi:hypothetical protein
MKIPYLAVQIVSFLSSLYYPYIQRPLGGIKEKSAVKGGFF